MKLGNWLIIGLFAALLVTAGLLLLPLFPLLPSPSMRGLLLAPVYAIFVSVLLQKSGFEGSLILFSLVMGVVLTIFTPLLLPVTFVAGLLSELLGFSLGRVLGYRPWTQSSSARYAAAAFFPAVQFPVMLYTLAIIGGPGSTVLLHPVLVLAFTGIGIILGLAGCILGGGVTKRIKYFCEIKPGAAWERPENK